MIDNNSKEFIYRHIGPSEEEQQKMLKSVGYKTLEDLMDNTVPEKILLKDDLKIDEPLSENDALKKLKSISKQNTIFRNFIGMGYTACVCPAGPMVKCHCDVADDQLRGRCSRALFRRFRGVVPNP